MNFHGEELLQFFRRDGTRYTGTSKERLFAWATDVEKGPTHIALNHFVGGGKLSTIWEGLDRGWSWMTGYADGAKPLIFETMFFREGDAENFSQEHYATEEEALAGHQERLAELLARGFQEAKQ